MNSIIELPYQKCSEHFMVFYDSVIKASLTLRLQPLYGILAKLIGFLQIPSPIVWTQRDWQTYLIGTRAPGPVLGARKERYQNCGPPHPSVRCDPSHLQAVRSRLDTLLCTTTANPSPSDGAPISHDIHPKEDHRGGRLDHAHPQSHRPVLRREPRQLHCRVPPAAAVSTGRHTGCRKRYHR
jgi:hypothetical protein